MTSSTWRALGNTYRLVESPGGGLNASEVSRLAAGTDGVLEIIDERDGRVEIAIWNPDGSQAELSGNGTRIAAAWHAGRSGASVVDVVVGARTVRCRFLADGEIEQDLGEVRVGAAETIDGVTFVPVDVGNPHAVVVGEPEEVLRLGPFLETHERFPERTNVQVVHVDGPSEITGRVWERGVGETSASGTSAVAAAAATHGAGTVVVHFPGGDLLVELSGGRAFLRGAAAQVD